MRTEDVGLFFKDRFCPLWSGLYCGVGSNPTFYTGAIGLPDLSRAIKAEKHDASVVVWYED